MNEQSRTCIVLGARGFIGRHVSRNLAAGGATVLGLGHGEWRQDEYATWGLCKWLNSEITADSILALAGDADIAAIVHCGGSGAVSHSYAAPLDDYRRSVASTVEALEFARSRGAKSPRVVLTSSAAVYGDQGDVDLVETATRSPVSPYGFHKLMAEQMCDSYARFFGVRVSIVRLFSVYGEGLSKQLLWDACRKFAIGEARFFGTGHELRDWIHVEDAAALLGLAACNEQSAFEIYNGGSAKATTRQVLSELGRSLQGVNPPTFSGEAHKGNPHRLTSDSSHARRQLHWSAQVGLSEGLRRYAHWFVGGTR